MTCLILQVSAPGLHQLLACDLMQNLVYLVQLHHCTKARYAYAPRERCEVLRSASVYMGLLVCLPLAYLNKSSAVAEMGDRLTTIGMGRK